MDNSPFAFGQMTPRQAPMTPRLQQVPERQERTRGGVPGLAIPIAETVSPSSSTQPSVCVSPTSPRGPAQPEPQPGEVSPTTMMHHVGDQDDVELNLESSKWKPNFSPDRKSDDSDLSKTMDLMNDEQCPSHEQVALSSPRGQALLQWWDNLVGA